MKKRLLAIIATLAMVVAMMPSMVFGASGLPAAVGGVITLTGNVTLTETFTVAAGETLTIDLNGHSISGTDTDALYSLIHVENGANLTIKDSSTNGTGKITYAAGADDMDSDYNEMTGTAVFVEGVLTQKSGTIEITGDWYIGFAVDVHPNAWGTNYTTTTNFVMDGGKIVASDSGVRVANYGQANSTPGASFTMNGGTIESAYDGIFIQHVVACDLDVEIKDGTITSTNSHAVRIYGDTAVNDINLNIGGGTFSGKMTNLDTTGSGDTVISGGTFSEDVGAYLANGVKQDAEGNVVCEEHSSASITSVVTAPTCTEDGYTTYTCGDCNYSWKADATKATGHTYKDGKCTVCGEKAPVKPEKSPNTGDNSVAPFAVAGLVLAAMAAAAVARRRYN